MACGAINLEAGWKQPPLSARVRAYWWWLNGNVTKESITRDLEEMKAKGWGGAIIMDANGAAQGGNDPVPPGPVFFSPAWRELYKHTLREASRLGLEIDLNIQSGWNLGGPMVTADDAAKKLVWSEQVLTGPRPFDGMLPEPKLRDHYAKDMAVLAYRIRPGLPKDRKPLQNFPEKAVYAALPSSAPKTDKLFEETPAQANEEDADTADVIDLTSKLSGDGRLRWEVPPGRWQVLRFVSTIGDHSDVSTFSDGWKGYAIDVLDKGAFDRYWDAVVEPLIKDAGPLAGKTLRYLHTDSWEVEPLNWTPKMREKFLKYRGYDMLPWMPVLAGRIVNGRAESDRFLQDFRKTLGDLAVDEHYQPFLARAHAHGLLIHPESGGPHAIPVDAQRCLGQDDMPMSEFWAWSWEHRIGDENRFFVKQPASAAHTYGHKLVAAEGFTTIGPHWQETVWDNLKPAFDHAITEGLNVLFWHAFVCSPSGFGLPGIQYFAGTHFNPNATWWAKSGPFISYLDRCLFMQQQGMFVADALYYYGDHAPNFAQLRSSDPARLGKGYDYDVITEEAILTRLAVKDGRLVLPDGMSYRVMVFPDRTGVSLAVLQKVQSLVAQGATIILPRPDTASGLTGFPGSDKSVRKIAAGLFGATSSSEPIDRKVGKGRVIDGKSAREVLLQDGLQPDFETTGASADIDYIHRRTDTADIYFLSSRAIEPVSIQATFRIAGKAPELWDAVSGERRFANAYREAGGRTTLPLDLPPCGSMFVIFRTPAADHPSVGGSNNLQFSTFEKLTGSWKVAFDPKWGGPGEVVFDDLISWTDRPEPGVRFYSGTAIYRKSFTVPSDAKERPWWLDLGEVREMAEIKVNGQSCGVAWAPPFRMDISRAIKPGLNELEIEVVNFWPNRIIGDASLPIAQRITYTNVRKLTASTKLMRSGLFGPVSLLRQDNSPPSPALGK